jgi:putative transposase
MRARAHNHDTFLPLCRVIFVHTSREASSSSRSRLPTGRVTSWCGTSTVYASVQKRYPFETIAICVLPDHLHAIWWLPEGDTDFSLRWSLIKAGFSRGLPGEKQRSNSKIAHRERGIWQRRYWEHAIRNDADLERHVDYIHFNPVKHGYVSQVSDWPHSSFHRYVARGDLPEDWGGEVGEASGNFGE